MDEARRARPRHRGLGIETASPAGRSSTRCSRTRERFTPPHKASRAVGRIKRAVQSGAEAGFGEGLALERELQQLLFESDDAREGIAANLEKRPPKFTGRTEACHTNSGIDRDDARTASKLLIGGEWRDADGRPRRCRS